MALSCFQKKSKRVFTISFNENGIRANIILIFIFFSFLLCSKSQMFLQRSLYPPKKNKIKQVLITSHCHGQTLTIKTSVQVTVSGLCVPPHIAHWAQRHALYFQVSYWKVSIAFQDPFSQYPTHSLICSETNILTLHILTSKIKLNMN